MVGQAVPSLDSFIVDPFPTTGSTMEDSDELTSGSDLILPSFSDHQAFTTVVKLLQSLRNYLRVENIRFKVCWYDYANKILT